MSNGEDGRPESVTKEQVLAMIKAHKTTSASKLASILGVSRATIYNKLATITDQERTANIGLIKETALLPAELDFEVFCNIDLIAKFQETLAFRRQTSKKYTERMVRGIFRVCRTLNISPSSLTPEATAELLVNIRKGTEKRIKETETKKAIRAWFGFRGIGEQTLTNLGIDGRQKRIGRDRSMTRLTREQRAAFMEAQLTLVQCDWKSGNQYSIPFDSEPYLADAMMELPKVAYYTGTRIGKEGNTGLLSQLWENVKFEPNMVIMMVQDKGKHGGITWYKKLVGEPAEEFKRFYEESGKPSAGRIFPFAYQAVVNFWSEVYEAAEIPKSLWEGMTCHIWRHTAAQDMLDATDWNYGMTAKTLGWETTLALEKHYGKMPDSSAIRGLLKAMGLPVTEERREFKF